MDAERIIEPALFGVIIPPNSSHYDHFRLCSIQIPDQYALLGVIRQERIIPVSKNPFMSEMLFWQSLSTRC